MVGGVSDKLRSMNAVRVPSSVTAFLSASVDRTPTAIRRSRKRTVPTEVNIHVRGRVFLCPSPFPSPGAIPPISREGSFFGLGVGGFAFLELF